MQHTVWPQLGTTVTLEDGITVIDEHGATLLYTQEIQDLLLSARLLDYDPRLEPVYDPSEPPSGHAYQHILAGVQEIDGDKLAIDITPPGYTPVVDALADNVKHLGAHLKGIGAAILAALAAAAAAAADAAAALAAAGNAASGVFWFQSVAQASGSGTTRVMNAGYGRDTQWGSNTMPYVIVPADGEISMLVARHVASTSGDTDTLTYQVLHSTTGGPTFTVTSLTVTISAASAAPERDITHTLAVSAGDLIAVQFVCSGTIANMPVPPGGGHYASVLWRAT